MSGGDNGAVMLVVERGASEVNESDVTALHTHQVMFLYKQCFNKLVWYVLASTTQIKATLVANYF